MQQILFFCWARGYREEKNILAASGFYENIPRISQLFPLILDGHRYKGAYLGDLGPLRTGFEIFVLRTASVSFQIFVLRTASVSFQVFVLRTVSASFIVFVLRTALVSFQVLVFFTNCISESRFCSIAKRMIILSDSYRVPKNARSGPKQSFGSDTVIRVRYRHFGSDTDKSGPR